MSLTAIIFTVLVVVMLGILPAWPYSRKWGYWPSGTVGVLIVIVLLVFYMGKP